MKHSRLADYIQEHKKIIKDDDKVEKSILAAEIVIEVDYKLQIAVKDILPIQVQVVHGPNYPARDVIPSIASSR